MEINSPVFFTFVMNMWLMCTVTEAQIEVLVTKGRLTREEADTILATPHDCD
jgi:hypothetical protein